MKYGNCLIWVVSQYITKGGYIKIQLYPDYFYVPRTYWSIDGNTWYRYTPCFPILHPTKIQNLFPFHVLLFEGYVKKVELWN